MEVVGLWVVSIILASMILSPVDKGGTGFLLGLILGPLGVVFAIVVRINSKRPPELVVQADGTVAEATRLERACPYCAESILAAAKVCKHCHRDIEPISQAALTKQAKDKSTDTLVGLGIIAVAILAVVLLAH